MSEKDLIAAMSEVMDMLCQLPVGGIGPDGPTWDELDAAAERGEFLDGEAVHDMGQRMYRTLEDAIRQANEEA